MHLCQFGEMKSQLDQHGRQRTWSTLWYNNAKKWGGLKKQLESVHSANVWSLKAYHK